MKPGSDEDNFPGELDDGDSGIDLCKNGKFEFSSIVVNLSCHTLSTKLIRGSTKQNAAQR